MLLVDQYPLHESGRVDVMVAGPTCTEWFLTGPNIFVVDVINYSGPTPHALYSLYSTLYSLLPPAVRSVARGGPEVTQRATEHSKNAAGVIPAKSGAAP